MFEKLKRLFRASGPEVEYRTPTEETPNVVPTGPPTMPYPPVLPVEPPDVEHDEEERP